MSMCCAVRLMVRRRPWILFATLKLSPCRAMDRASRVSTNEEEQIGVSSTLRGTGDQIKEQRWELLRKPSFGPFPGF